MKQASDFDQLVFATDARRTIFTANRSDFARLHKDWMVADRRHTGIIVRARQQISVGAQARALISICSSLDEKNAENLFTYLEAWIES